MICLYPDEQASAANLGVAHKTLSTVPAHLGLLTLACSVGKPGFRECPQSTPGTLKSARANGDLSQGTLGRGKFCLGDICKAWQRGRRECGGRPQGLFEPEDKEQGKFL